MPSKTFPPKFDSNIISPSPPAPNNLVLSSKKLSETTLAF